MQLPEDLRRAVENQMTETPASVLARASAEISQAYKGGRFVNAPLKTPVHRLAYLQVRMPATYAACHHVFVRLREEMPDFEPKSLLDLGAGPGTASWAAIEAFPNIDAIELVERDSDWMRIGQTLTTSTSHPSLRRASWKNADLRMLEPAPYDLVVLSYAIGELPVDEATRIIAASMRSARVLAIIEPGTPKSFARIAELRKQLIAGDARIAAPCPHENECPLLARGDWCHFAERLERTAGHRRIKGATLGYEDEKFSYLIATRLAFPNRAGRIVRHPQIRPGYVELEVCAPEGLEKTTVTRSQKDSYRAARKSKWGDRWPFS